MKFLDSNKLQNAYDKESLINHKLFKIPLLILSYKQTLNALSWISALLFMHYIVLYRFYDLLWFYFISILSYFFSDFPQQAAVLQYFCSLCRTAGIQPQLLFILWFISIFQWLNGIWLLLKVTVNWGLLYFV